jgi:hypothetical protein
MKTATFKMKHFRDHRGSVRFEATDSDSPVRTIYLARPMSNDIKELKVTIEDVTPVLTAQDPTRQTKLEQI